MKYLFLYITLMMVLLGGQMTFAGSVSLTPANGQTIYESTPGESYVVINYGWTLSSGTFSYSVKAWIDGIEVPNPGYSMPLSYGSHYGHAELKEYDYIGRLISQSTDDATFSFQPSYYIYAKNSFEAPGQIKIDGSTETTANIEVGYAIRKTWGKSVTHSLEAIDNQTINNLLRTWYKWTYNDIVNSNILISPSVTSQTTFMANFHSQPTIPQNMAVSAAAPSYHPKIQWARNSEADVVSYKVYRNGTEIATVSQTSGGTNPYYVDPNITWSGINQGDMQVSYYTKAVSQFSLYSQPSATVSITTYREIQDKTGFAFQQLPNDYSLLQNYPNPFNPSTDISYSVPEASFVSVSVFNSVGQEISKLVNGFKESGNYTVSWNASNLPSGVYFYTMTAGKFSETKRMILTK
ncbi:MAG: T9SS type A sorting domain-containing protein [Bacteroidota bacterium]